VNYRSFSLHVNPNLYPSSTVCLTLLNTFGSQDEAELWSPGLVLTAQPYYNEPAWAQDGTSMGQRNELPYSESTFQQSLQTMLHLLHRPSAGIEEFVRDDFRRCGQHVIRACEAYRDGCLQWRSHRV
jgi:ubiquitin-conjugating enzyme E2 O